MNLISAGITSAILAAGVAGSVAAYRSQAAPASEIVPVQPSEPPAVVKWAPCQVPSRLENGVCVTDVVRTVVRPAPSDDAADDVYGEERGDRDDERVDDDDEFGWSYDDDEEREDDD